MEINSPVYTNSYLPPVQFFSHWVNENKPQIEKHCNYIKQTYRNRCDILAANGVISLTVPVAKGRRMKVKTRDIEISYDTNWQSLHWKSIVSAYNSSPFFEFYMDDFKPFFEKKYQYLFDLNVDILTVILDALDLDTNIEFTNDYNKTEDVEVDYRNIIHPKKDYKLIDPNFTPLKYRQVFQDRFDFIPNLSVIDLLFNKGPEALDWLEDSVVKT